MHHRYDNLMFNLEDLSDRCPGFGDYHRLLGQNGYCYGLVHMWGRAILLPNSNRRVLHNGFQKKIFENRLDILTRDYYANPLRVKSKEYKRLSDFLNENIIPIEKLACNFKGEGRLNYCSRACREAGILHENYKLYISIRAFLDGLLLYQNPYSVKDKGYLLYEKAMDGNGAEKKEVLKVQSARMASLYVGPKDRAVRLIESNISSKSLDSNFVVKDKIGIVEIYNRPYVIGNSISQKTKFIDLMEYAKQISDRFYFCISSVNHAIGVTFNNDRYEVYDANLMTNKGISSIEQGNSFYYAKYSNIS